MPSGLIVNNHVYDYFSSYDYSFYWKKIECFYTAPRQETADFHHEKKSRIGNEAVSYKNRSSVFPTHFTVMDGEVIKPRPRSSNRRIVLTMTNVVYLSMTW